MKPVLLVLVSAAAVSLSACGSQPAAEQPSATASPVAAATPVAPPPAAKTASAAPALFAQCAVCHTATKDGKAGIGPNLWGTAGHPAAQKPGFAYSPALKAAGLVWDDATLDKWLQKPQAFVPGTKMVFAGVPDAAKRAELIAYLKTLG
ncbi:c-type cytochrome [Sphingomonas hengshuiensis]|uniref:Cytochrome c domain-containing protein n=1 Tax=Sphingomonas hengshuiensis TaxID=1609977 RepID=A0A7U4J7C7_9SPHN|nr:c-type cytochrome [Sphingomonas hengshuiensis]AJP71601.1 hypothetical protein TS85_07100 [Sphingomonas hengshuiensis]